MARMKIAAIQMVSTPDVDRNLHTARELIARAASEGARLVGLPEYFCLMGRRDQDKLLVAEAAGQGPIQEMLREAARSHGIWLIGGTMPVRLDAPGQPERVRNTCWVFGPEGQVAARYDKIHLFAFDNGKERYDEGQVLERGSQPVAFEAAGHKVGLSVCYDVRFPELYRSLAPCDLLCVPAAFTYTTGQAHWELLLRARAVENQCYVMAPAQGGVHENGRRTWGHTMVIDPWGEVLAVQPEGVGVVSAELDDQRLTQVRTQLPALAHRRLSATPTSSAVPGSS
jgi:nitrilase